MIYANFYVIKHIFDMFGVQNCVSEQKNANCVWQLALCNNVLFTRVRVCALLY